MTNDKKNRFVSEEDEINPIDFPPELWKALPEHIKKRLEARGYVDGKVPEHLKRKEKNEN
jgi:hypothetical protein